MLHGYHLLFRGYLGSRKNAEICFSFGRHYLDRYAAGWWMVLHLEQLLSSGIDLKWTIKPRLLASCCYVPIYSSRLYYAIVCRNYG
jgi:hypothetical protein